MIFRQIIVSMHIPTFILRLGIIMRTSQVINLRAYVSVPMTAAFYLQSRTERYYSPEFEVDFPPKN